jgi:hypothetical protein
MENLNATVEKIVFDVQMCAEQTHCASALLGAENYLLEYLKSETKNKQDSEREKLKMQMNEACREALKEALANSGQSTHPMLDKYNQLLEAYNESPPTVTVRAPEIYIIFADDFSANAGRKVAWLGDGHIHPIVLPREHAITIEKALSNDSSPETWNDPQIKDIKERLQYLTLHELLHILIRYKMTSATPHVEESIITEFANQWRQHRAKRGSVIYCSVESANEPTT